MSAARSSRCGAHRAGPVTARQKFCEECGAALSRAAGHRPPVPTVTVTPPSAAELRMASVLFVDLVGFTSLSESRDAEDVRELAQRLFRCRSNGRRPLRRRDREVHWRRGDGGLGGAQGARGRRRARGQSGAGDRRCRDRVRRASGGPGAAGPGRGGHRPGRRARRIRGGDRGRRPGQHRRADPDRGRAGHGPRRRGHPTGDARPRSPTRTPATTCSRARTSRSASGGRRASSAASGAHSASRAWRRHSWVATPTCG